jgi:hypothetical protein
LGILPPDLLPFLPHDTIMAMPFVDPADTFFRMGQTECDDSDREDGYPEVCSVCEARGLLLKCDKCVNETSCLACAGLPTVPHGEWVGVVCAAKGPDHPSEVPRCGQGFDYDDTPIGTIATLDAVVGENKVRPCTCLRSCNCLAWC